MTTCHLLILLRFHAREGEALQRTTCPLHARTLPRARGDAESRQLGDFDAVMLPRARGYTRMKSGKLRHSPLGCSCRALSKQDDKLSSCLDASTRARVPPRRIADKLSIIRRFHARQEQPKGEWTSCPLDPRRFHAREGVTPPLKVLARTVRPAGNTARPLVSCAWPAKTRHRIYIRRLKSRYTPIKTGSKPHVLPRKNLDLVLLCDNITLPEQAGLIVWN